MCRRLFSLLLLTLVLAAGARAVASPPAGASRLRVSLLTCAPGPEAYERFGHTGLRVQVPADSLGNPASDVVFHYGVFSFNTPNFIYRFVKGETDYQLGLVPTSRFVEEYRQRGLGMTECRLALTDDEARLLLAQLVENYQPRNRTYRYSYFFRNCATCPYRQVLDAVPDVVMTARDGTLPWMDSRQSLRDLVTEKVHAGNWLDMGIALCVAGRADRRPTTVAEQVFLPDHLELALRHARVRRTLSAADSLGRPSNVVVYRPLVDADTVLLVTRPEVAAAIDADAPVTPLLAMLAVLALAVAVTCLRRRPRLARWFDTLLLLTTGLAGLLVWYLNFFSLHPAVDHNWNCLWLLPTNVVFAVVIWCRTPRRVRLVYFSLLFASLLVYMIAVGMLRLQFCHLAFLPVIAALLIRSLDHIGTAFAEGREKPDNV